jgi:hypothetical protein
MKTNTVSPSKKKAGSAAKKKALSTSKEKPVSAAKQDVDAPAKKKPRSLAKQKRELHAQVMEFAATGFKGKRLAYFVRDIERTKEGAYIMCVAVEGESGFYKLDWAWHCSLTRAKTETALMNKKLGLNEEKVNEIIISTMGPLIRRKK